MSIVIFAILLSQFCHLVQDVTSLLRHDGSEGVNHIVLPKTSVINIVFKGCPAKTAFTVGLVFFFAVVRIEEVAGTRLLRPCSA